jgi:asparagine synthetase A
MITPLWHNWLGQRREYSILSPEYNAAFIIKISVLPSTGLSHAVATDADAMGTSLIGEYSPINGDTLTH